LGRIWQKVVIARFEVVSLHLLEEIEEYHEAVMRIVGLQAEIETPISRT
jgi:hypothetical protein